MRYGFERQMRGATVDQAIERVTTALASEGFGILTRIDVQDTLKKKLGVDIASYTILGACNPSLAHRALTAEPQIGLLLPCNVVVQEAEDGALVSIADPRAMFQAVDNPAMEQIVKEVGDRVRRVIDSLA